MWEGGSGWGTHVNPWLILVNVWQKPLQYCKVISLQLIKINEKKKQQYFLFREKLGFVQVRASVPVLFSSRNSWVKHRHMFYYSPSSFFFFFKCIVTTMKRLKLLWSGVIPTSFVGFCSIFLPEYRTMHHSKIRNGLWCILGENIPVLV